MRTLALIFVLALAACSVQEPLDALGPDDPVETDTTDNGPPENPIPDPPSSPLPIVQFSVASPVEVDYNAPVDTVLAGPFNDVDMFSNAERRPKPSRQGRWLNSEGSSFALQLSVNCEELPKLVLTDFYLLQIPDSVNIRSWMGLLNYDVASISDPWRQVPVDTHRVASARVTAVDPVFEYRYISSQTRYIYEMTYGLRLEDVVFENGVSTVDVETDRHLCFPGDGFGLSPEGDS